MCEYSGMSSAAALRDARRRKILENSENRLKLIQGINSSLEKPHTEKCSESTQKCEVKISEHSLRSTENPKPEINSKINDICKENKELKEISDFILRGNTNVDEDEEKEAKVGNEDGEKGTTIVNSFLEKKLHYILLALIVNVMLSLNVGHLFYENVFCPFYTVKLVEILSKREMEQLHPVLLLFIAGLPNKLQKLTKVLLLMISILLSDLCLYLFTFIVGNEIATSLG